MCFPFMKQFWQKQYKRIIIAALACVSPAMHVWAGNDDSVQETENTQEETEIYSQVEELISTEEISQTITDAGEEISQTITDAGEELVEEIGEEVKEKAKEVKRNVLLTLWEHIKQMFHDFFLSIFGEKE